MKIRDLMTTTVQSCGPDESLAVAARLMWDNDVGCIPVIGADSRPIAVLTDRDACMAALTQGRPLHEIPVRTAMSTSLYLASADESVGRAEEVMRNHQVRRLPVVDGEGRLVGLLSMNDIAREAMRERPRRAHEVTSDEVTATLAAVCRPRVCSVEAHKRSALALS